jgi:hypothetical protein
MWTEISVRNAFPARILFVLAVLGQTFVSAAAEAGSIAKKVGVS